ncbi:BnaC04g55270D [Brassica napus]|uniref:BnaC04g55270D protein n=1 Tax=Brassica napus TaxID=3708 RepID=A0A078INQ3_BRANA|nr:BnaC04g55270D [Brassica napus]
MCLRSSESFPGTRTPTMTSASRHNKRKPKTQIHLRALVSPGSVSDTFDSLLAF